MAVGIAASARRADALSTSGAAAAVAVGTACVAAGWSWGALLIAFFVVSTALSRLGRAEKAARTAGVVAKGGARDARQVLANGGFFTLAAVGSLVAPGALPWTAAGAGALAAATADTWGTEVGTLVRQPPRLVTTGRPVAPGTSGAVTTAGTLASVAGALFVAGLAAVAGWGAPAALGALAGGLAGAAADTVLGATLQARRHCPRCDAPTERLRHACGEPTRLAGGLPWFDNDGVNLASGLLGLAAGAACAV